MASNRTTEEWAEVVREKIQQVLGGEEAGSVTVDPDYEKKLAQYIDHTLLKPDATPAQIDALCNEALQYGFKSCCVNGANVAQVARRLEGSASIACAVIGFPLGASTSPVKAYETEDAIRDGAREIDMVVNVGALKAGLYPLVFSDIAAVVSAAGKVPVKVILETALLTDAEKVAGSFIAAEAGAAFVKTCTGFGGGGASVSDVSLMRKAVAYKPEVQVKASAAIRSYEACVAMIRAGATRIGTSSGVTIMAKSGADGHAY
ncbi:hypothetical protein HGRIS_005340 [Hohenbuehelia grisea]|uniref:deoxyribose-phosphate aldolase n=1 Tax=Hohenbuehelia grisea TaxID=104357 RepID=A0ABR3JFM0_9AGAR